MTRRRRLILLAVATCHLGLAVTGALGICLWQAGAIGRTLTYYCALSGIDSKYSYFAPSVRTPLDAAFTLVDGAGGTVADTLATGVTREADIRVQDLIQVFHHDRADDAVRQQIARSWAAVMLARHPGAEAVLVEVRHPRLPSMAALRRGAEIDARPVFRARIARARAAAASP